MQEVPSEGEIDWSKTIDQLVSSPQQSATVPRTFKSLRPTATAFEHQKSSTGGQVASEDVPMVANVQGEYRGFNHPQPAAMGRNTDHGSIAGGPFPYSSNSAVSMAMVPYQQSLPCQLPLRLTDLIKQGQFDLPSDSNTHGSNQRNKRRRPDHARSGHQQYHVPHQYQQPPPMPLSALDQQQLAHIPEDNTADMFASTKPDPTWLNDAVRNNKLPTFEQAALDMPFVDPTDGRNPPRFGVVRFVNPPYYVTRAEVLAALGSTAMVVSQPIGTPFHAIHILMERDTGKTQDIFVEVINKKEARTIAANFERRASENRSVTLGRARANLQLSSPEALLRALFPQARKTTWQNNKAIVDKSVDYYYEGTEAVGFDGFLGKEETALLCKWLDSPGRSPFAQQCLMRPYENAITLLHKYPIDNPDNIIMADRFRLYSIARVAIEQLCEVLHSQKCPPTLTRWLLREVVVAAFSQVIFSDAQRARLFALLRNSGFDDMVTNPGMVLRDVNLHEFAFRWPFLAYQRKPLATDKLVRFYAKMIREYNQEDPPQSLAQGEHLALANLNASLAYNEPFVGVRVPYKSTDLETLGLMTWRECAAAEREYICSILMARLSPSRDG